MFGCKLRSHLDLLKPDLHHLVENNQEKQKATHDKHLSYQNFNVGDPVFVCNFFCRPPWLPATITNRCGPLSFKVKVLEGGMVWRRHQDQLRQRSVIGSEAACAIAQSVSIPYYYDLLIPDDSTASAANETEESGPVKHPLPCRNSKRKRTQPKRYVA